MKSALIINEGFSHNLGDQAINKAMTSYFTDNNYQTAFVYLSKPNMLKLPNYDYKQPVEKKKRSIIKPYFIFFYWFLINRKRLKNILTEKQYDIVVFGGGQLINGSGKKYPHSFAIAAYWLTLLIKKYTNAPIYFIAVGIGEKLNWIEKKLYEIALNRTETLFARDKFSVDSFVRYFNKHAILIPDIAFYDKRDMDEKLEKKEIALIGITSFEEVYKRYNDSQYSKEDYFQDWYKKIVHYKEKRYDIKLFYTTILDAQECAAFKDYIYIKYNIELAISPINTLDDLLVELKSAKIVYSGRMHALILAKNYGCICEPYLISQKLKSFNYEYIQTKRTAEELSQEVEITLNHIFSV